MSYSDKCLDTTNEVLVTESITCIDWFGNNKMQANPDKFQAIVLGKLGFENCKSPNTGDTEIKCEDSVKLLGVTFGYMLHFDVHSSNICKKAARQISVLLRLSKFLSLETKVLIYKSFIRSNFNLCPLVWQFCSKTSSDKMEKLQYRALCLVFNDFNSYYEALLEKVKMPSLHISRIRLIAMETFKILHKMAPVYLQDLVCYKNSAYSFRYENLVDLPRVRTTKFVKSTFCYEAAVVWSSLPNELRKVEDFGLIEFYFSFFSLFLFRFSLFLFRFSSISFYFLLHVSQVLCQSKSLRFVWIAKDPSFLHADSELERRL